MRLFKLTITALALSMITNAWAGIPQKCPGISAMQDAPFDLVMDTQSGYAVYQLSGIKYDTNEKWGLAMYDIKADSKEDASKQAKEILSSLTLTQGPILVWGHEWQCSYSSPTGYKMIAATHDNDNSTLLRRSLIK